MSVRYLFNSDGEYVAFLQGDNVFSPDADWLGFVRNGNEFYSTEGEFLGYVLGDDRVARLRSEPRRPRVLKPFRPFKPFTPLRPLRRLRMPRLPAGYEDVFSHGIAGMTPEAKKSIEQFESLEGAKIYAADSTFLGTISRNSHSPDSLSNPYSVYGNAFNVGSLFNQYGQYGNPFSLLSPFNQYSRTPPRIVRGQEVVAYLTVNEWIAPRIDPNALLAWLKAA